MSARLKKLQDRDAAIHKAMNALLDAADKDGRDLTEEETKAYSDHEAERKTIRASIEREKGLADLERTMAPVVDRNAPEPTNTDAAANADPRIKVGKPNAEADPKKGFKTPREFMLAVMNAGMSSRPKVDERLKSLKVTAAAGSDEHGEYSDSYGNYFIPEGFSPEILKLDPESDPIGSRTRRVPMAQPIVKFNARVDKVHSTSVSGGLRVYRRQEADTVASSRMQHEQVTLEAHSLFGVAYATEELLVDSPISFAALLAAGFSDEFTSVLINERLNGTGAGEMKGVMNADALISVAKETGQAATTLVYENIIKMRARCWGYSNAVWLANHDTVPQLMLLNQSVGTGGMPVWQPSALQDHPDTLLGRPLIFTEYAKTLGTKGDVVLANWGEYLEGVLQPLQSAESMHVRFLEHERTFKFWMRIGGAPWWRTALTPKNGSTLSPFVVLDTRA